MARAYHTISTLSPVNVFSYDYHGYGASSAEPGPSEASIIADVEAAYDALVNRVGVNPKSIILYGQSIGSVPTVDLASRLEADQLAGVVIQSGFTSASKLICSASSCFNGLGNHFNNLPKVPSISVPVLVMHGTHDEIVPLAHGVELYKAARRAVAPCFIEGAGHNDLINRNEFHRRLEKFTRELERIEEADDINR